MSLAELTQLSSTIDLTHFRSHGWQIIRGVLDASDIADLRSFLESEMELVIAQIRHALNCAPDDDVSLAIERFCAMDGNYNSLATDLRYALAGQYPLKVRLDEHIREVCRSQSLRSILNLVFPGERLRLHMPPMARFVLPNNLLAGVPPHQDISYNRHLSNFVTVWVPLVEVDDRCGGVSIFDGTAELPEQLNELNRTVWLPAIEDLGYSKVACHMRPGDLLLFTPLVVHESLPNTSDRVRFSVDFRFFGENSTSTKHYLELDTWAVVGPTAPQQ
jgi:hypothetical protein